MREEIGLAVSVGIAPVKMVAKIASDLAKPDGLLEVPAGGVASFLDPLPVGHIWGVGPVARRRLEALGIHSVGDLARAEGQRLEQELGSWGLEMARLARGEDLREVHPCRAAVSYSEENTFGRDVSDRAMLVSTLVTHAESVARRLRRDGVFARTVVLKVKLGRRVKSGPRGYPLLTRRRTLREPSDDGLVFSQVATGLLDKLTPLEPVRLIGVGVTNLLELDEGQLSLLGARATPERAQLNRALDEIRDRFGSAAIARGGAPEAERAGLSTQIKRGER